MLKTKKMCDVVLFFITTGNFVIITNAHNFFSFFIRLTFIAALTYWLNISVMMA